MSKESANQFLEVAAHDTTLREKFTEVDNPQDFVKAAEEAGYYFTTEELKEVVKEHSEGATLRRTTGVWQWLRTVKWYDSSTTSDR